MSVLENELIEIVSNSGMSNYGVCDIAQVDFSDEFRAMCKSNSCGNYGRCYMCPPDCGDIYELMEKSKSYKKIIAMNYIGTIEDSYDFEGMMDISATHHKILLEMKKKLNEKYGVNNADILLLGSGGCGVCEKCSKIDNQPCRFPDLAMSSLEGYGFYVSKLAGKTGLKYINGQNSVTYFGGLLFND